MDSILLTIKSMLGLDISYNAYDVDLIIYINMAFNILNQIGVGPSEGFSIHDETAEWQDYIPDMSKLEMVKAYVYMKTRQVFDPGTNSSLNNAIENQIKELESRLSFQVDPGEVTN